MPFIGRRRGAALLVLALVLAACGESSVTPSGAPASPSASEAATPAPTASDQPTQPPTEQPTPSFLATVYTVRAGDTLSSISRAWGTTVAQLQAWNADRYPSLAENPNVL